MILVVACLLIAGPVWADASASQAAAPPFEETDDEFYDPFDEGSEDLYGDEGEAMDSVADPIAGFNRAMFSFNDKLYFWVLKPVASGYRVILPTPVRVSIKNFFFNLLMPVRLVNCLLQGKGRAAEGEFGRFVTNSTAGMLGFLNPAKDYPHLNPPEEDLGQTLGHYGVDNGFYIVWPVFGPSTLRDTVGSFGDWALNPFSFMKLVNVDSKALTSDTTNVAVYTTRTVNDTSFRIGDYEALKNAALDPYEAFRNAYIQNRDSKIAE
ncbi:ABC transporter [Desulfosarcina alkanivorans]|uniref:ABC transporter n=2 Tax=Desulfosarcina alkanivorans TaxID=571177 RepID=A0A5K7YM62_9BACT|nr:ABC transporter [Desulfosarcina alkanivorans]